jgi:nucleotide-binding universal stress UspA family protein
LKISTPLFSLGACQPANTNVLVRLAESECQPRILLAVDTMCTSSDLSWAAALARRMRGELHIVGVPSKPARMARGARLNWAVGDASLCIDTGAFLDRVALRAAEVGARMIVIAGEGLRPGEDIASLARVTQTPVLVARGRLEAGPVLGATDLRDAGLHVLRRSAEMGLLIEAPVVAVHNDSPLKPAACSSPTANVDASLTEATARVPSITMSVLRSDDDSVQAILEEAQSMAAALVVVGTRCRPASERIRRKSTATRVVLSADCSVMVTPIPPQAAR